MQHVRGHAKYLAILAAFCMLVNFLVACKDQIEVEEQFQVDQAEPMDLLAEWKERMPEAIIVDTVQTDINQDGKLDLIVAYCIAENQMANVLNQLSVWADGYPVVGFVFDNGAEQYLMGSLKMNDDRNLEFDSYSPKKQAVIAREIGIELDPTLNSVSIILLSEEIKEVTSKQK